MRIAHLSDLHFGRISQPGILEALASDVNEAHADLVVISGDFTQRALHRQFRDARTWLAKLRAPQLVVPGNHDVFPWWRPGARVFSPLSRYRVYLGPEMTRTFKKEGLAVLGINSAHGRTIKGGRITRASQEAITAFFSDTAPSDFKILTLHHHLVPLEGLMPHDVAEFGSKTFEIALKSGVNLILCGHIHVSHVETLDGNDGQDLVVASAGTATSSRGRRSNKFQNFYNLIDVTPSQFFIKERQYMPDQSIFIETRVNRFDRR